jgi:hypothetical protein
MFIATYSDHKDTKMSSSQYTVNPKVAAVLGQGPNQSGRGASADSARVDVQLLENLLQTYANLSNQSGNYQDFADAVRDVMTAGMVHLAKAQQKMHDIYEKAGHNPEKVRLAYEIGMRESYLEFARGGMLIQAIQNITNIRAGQDLQGILDVQLMRAAVGAARRITGGAPMGHDNMLDQLQQSIGLYVNTASLINDMVQMFSKVSTSAPLPSYDAVVNGQASFVTLQDVPASYFSVRGAQKIGTETMEVAMGVIEEAATIEAQWPEDMPAWLKEGIDAPAPRVSGASDSRDNLTHDEQRLLMAAVREVYSWGESQDSARKDQVKTAVTRFNELAGSHSAASVVAALGGEEKVRTFLDYVENKLGLEVAKIG